MHMNYSHDLMEGNQEVKKKRDHQLKFKDGWWNIYKLNDLNTVKKGIVSLA